MAPSLDSVPHTTPPSHPKEKRPALDLERDAAAADNSNHSPSFYPGGLPPAPAQHRRSGPVSQRSSSNGASSDSTALQSQPPNPKPAAGPDHPSHEPAAMRQKRRAIRSTGVPLSPMRASSEEAERERMEVDDEEERAASGGEERALDDDDGSDLSDPQSASNLADGGEQEEEQDELVEEEVRDGRDDTVGPQVVRSKKSQGAAAAGGFGRRAPRGGSGRQSEESGEEANPRDSPAELGPEDRNKAAAYAERMRAAAAMGATPSPAQKSTPLPSTGSQPPQTSSGTQRSNSASSQADQASTPAQGSNGAHLRSNSAAEDRKPRVSDAPAKAGTPGGVTPPPKDDPRLENALLSSKSSQQKSFPPPTEGGNLLPQEVDKFLQLIEKHNLDASDDAGMARSVTLLYQEWLEWCARAGTRSTKSKKALVGEFVRIHQGAYGTLRQKRAMAIVEGNGARNAAQQASLAAPQPGPGWSGPPRGAPPVQARPAPIAPAANPRHPNAGPPVQLQTMPTRTAMGPPPAMAHANAERKRMVRPSPIVVVGSNIEQVRNAGPPVDMPLQGPPPPQSRPRPPPGSVRPPPPPPHHQQQPPPPPSPHQPHAAAPPPPQVQPPRVAPRLAAPPASPAVSSPRVPVHVAEVAAAAVNAGFDPHSPRPRSARSLPPGLFDLMKADIRNDILAEVDQMVNAEVASATREANEANRGLRARVEQLEQHADNLALWIHHITAQLGMSTGAGGTAAGEGSRSGSPHSGDNAHHIRHGSGPSAPLEAEEAYPPPHYPRERKAGIVPTTSSATAPQPGPSTVSAPRYRHAPAPAPAPQDDEYDHPHPPRRDDGYGAPPPRGHSSHQMAAPPGSSQTVQGGPPPSKQQSIRSRPSYYHGRGHGPGPSNGHHPTSASISASYQREAAPAGAAGGRGVGDPYGPPPGAGSGKISYASAAASSGTGYDHAPPQRIRGPPVGYPEEERSAKRPRHIG